MDQPRNQGDAATTGRLADDPDAPAPEGTMREALARLRELQAYAQHYLAARVDLVKLSVRNAILWTVIGVIGLCIASTVLLTAAVLLVIGLAQAIAALCGGRMWAGNLIVGGFILIATVVGAWVAIRAVTKSSRTRTVKRYERRLQQERVTLDGADAQQRSQEFVSGAPRVE